jgi:hypothetical protein
MLPPLVFEFCISGRGQSPMPLPCFAFCILRVLQLKLDGA